MTPPKNNLGSGHFQGCQVFFLAKSWVTQNYAIKMGPFLGTNLNYKVWANFFLLYFWVAQIHALKQAIFDLTWQPWPEIHISGHLTQPKKFQGVLFCCVPILNMFWIRHGLYSLHSSFHFSIKIFFFCF